MVRGLDTIIDTETGASASVDYYHHMIHRGHYFRSSDTVQSIAAAGTLNYLIKLGANEGHFQPTTIVSSADKLYIEFFDSSVVSADGTSIQVMAHNRNDSITPTTVVYRAPTITSAGALFSSGYIPGATGVGGTRSGSSTSGSQEFVLKANTNYIMRFTNGSSDSNSVFFVLQWYEDVEN